MLAIYQKIVIMVNIEIDNPELGVVYFYSNMIVLRDLIKISLRLFCTKIYEYSIKIFLSKGAVELLEEPQNKDNPFYVQM